MRIIKKISSLILIIGLIVPLSLISTPTNAYFNDTEISDSNIFGATSLDFEIDAGDWEVVGDELEININTSIARDLDLDNVGSLSFQYSTKFEYTSGNEDFCKILDLEALRETVLVYNGTLFEFTASGSGFIVDQALENWNFVVTASSLTSEFALAECHFDFVFDAWQIGLDKGQGFHDTERVSNIFIAANITEDNVSPIHDAYITEDQAGANYGASPSLSVDNTLSENRRTFIKFDFTLPPTSAVYSSTLNMHLKDAPAHKRQYLALRAFGDWSQDTINWRNQPALSGPITDIVDIGTTSDSWVEWNVTYDVRGFVSGDPNYGWGILDNFEDHPTIGRAGFESSENNNEENRPYLEIIFAPPVADTAYVVINEVYYNVDSPTRGVDEDNEWVELYNPTNSGVDISGWDLCDGNDICSEIPSSTIIPAKGFAVVAKDNTTWSFWPELHTSALKVELGSIIGNGLANSGDTVYLLDGTDTEVDAVSYGSDTYKLSPSVPSSGKGKSIARVVKGYDTGFDLDWIKNATPNPGTNPSDSGLEIFKITSEGIEVNDGSIWMSSDEISTTTQEPGSVEEEAEEFIEEDKKEEPQAVEEVEVEEETDDEEPVEEIQPKEDTQEPKTEEPQEEPSVEEDTEENTEGILEEQDEPEEDTTDEETEEPIIENPELTQDDLPFFTPFEESASESEEIVEESDPVQDELDLYEPPEEEQTKKEEPADEEQPVITEESNNETEEE